MRAKGRARCERQRRGISMVEVLVCIGIVALLAGLLVPALRAGSAASRSARCTSNLKQLGVAANTYTALHSAFPCAIRYENNDGQFTQVAWDWVTTFSGEVVRPGAIWSFTSNPGAVMQCPDFDGDSTAPGDPYTGYNYNTTYLGGEGVFPSVGWAHVRKGVPVAACARATSCAMFGDGGWKAGANKFMRAPENSESLSLNVLYAGGQAFRHAGCTHVVCIDGHVATFQQPFRGPAGADELLAEVMGYPENGFLSDDDSRYDPR